MQANTCSVRLICFSSSTKSCKRSGSQRLRLVTLSRPSSTLWSTAISRQSSTETSSLRTSSSQPRTPAQPSSKSLTSALLVSLRKTSWLRPPVAHQVTSPPRSSSNDPTTLPATTGAWVWSFSLCCPALLPSMTKTTLLSSRKSSAVTTISTLARGHLYLAKPRTSSASSSSPTRPRD